MVASVIGLSPQGETRLCTRHHETPVCLAQHQTGQPARTVGAGIDADTVAQILGCMGNGVAVNDDLAWKRTARFQKLRPYPEEILLLLLFQGAARPHTRMHEDVVPLDMTETTVAQELDMSGRDRGAQPGSPPSH